jgi:hypothetical protein
MLKPRPRRFSGSGEVYIQHSPGQHLALGQWLLLQVQMATSVPGMNLQSCPLPQHSPEQQTPLAQCALSVQTLHSPLTQPWPPGQ